MPRLRIETDPAWGERNRDAWRELLADAEFATPFQSPEWVETWWRHFGGRRQRLWAIAEEGDDLVGLWPLMASRSAWRTVRAVGTRQSDYLHPISRRGTMVSWAGLVEQLPKADLLDLHQIRESIDLGWESQVVEQARCLVLDLPPTYDEYLASLGKSLRFDCRRLDKKPFATGEASMELVTENGLDEAMSYLFALHGQRWRRRGLPGAFHPPRIQAFHRDVARQMVSRGGLRLSVLRTQNQAVGAIYAFQEGATTFFYQCGFDPAAKSLSPGTLLVASTIRRAIEDGSRVFDFLRGDEDYKRRWQPQRCYANQRHLIALNPLRGGIGKAINDASSRIENQVRARWEGKSLLPKS